MKVKRLGEGLYEIRTNWFTMLSHWSLTKPLAETLILIQGYGRVITAVFQTSVIPCVYLVCTTDKQVGRS